MIQMEHWKGPENETFVSTYLEDGTPRTVKQRILHEDDVLCCIITGETYNEVMQKYYSHQHWGEYKPTEDME